MNYFTNANSSLPYHHLPPPPPSSSLNVEEEMDMTIIHQIMTSFHKNLVNDGDDDINFDNSNSNSNSNINDNDNDNDNENGYLNVDMYSEPLTSFQGNIFLLNFLLNF